MANVASQADALRDLLVQLTSLYDPTIDVSSGSAFWNQVVQPFYEALGVDPFSTDVRSFLKARVAQAYPSISAQDGDQLADLLITPLEVLLEPFKREEQLVRAGQTARYPDRLRLEDAKDLAANFFTTWNGGHRSTGPVRVYFSAPTYAAFNPTTEFSTPEGLKYYPVTSTVVRPEQMILFRSGTEFYADVVVSAAEPGTKYDADKGTITSVKGIGGYTRAANLSRLEGGLDSDTAQQLLERTKTSLTERSLVVRRGVVSRINTDFPQISDVEVIGKGDPEMNRDVITGGGEGSVRASGVCFVVGQFAFMFSMFEDRGAKGTDAISEGDEVELNFWSFLYETATGAANEKFTIDEILFDSRNSIPDLPSVLLFRMSGAPSVTKPVVGVLPGVLPCVFAVVRGPGKIEISDVPGGILNPDTPRGTIEIEDGKVHVGGYYDVWLRVASPSTDSVSMNSVRSETALVEGDDLVVSGESNDYRHLVHRAYEVTSTSSFLLGSTIECAASGARAVISDVTFLAGTYTYSLWEMNGVEFAIGDSVVGGGTISGVSSQDWADLGVRAGMALSIPVGNEEGTYKVLKVEGPFLYLDIELTTTAKGQLFRVIEEVAISLFDPKVVLVPFGEADGSGLSTVIGSKTVRVPVNLQAYGASVGDTLEVLDGDDRGTYTISAWDSTFGGSRPVLSAAMTATNSGRQYRVYRSGQAVQRPLLRIVPDGVSMLDSAKQDSGYRIPNSVPVGAVAPRAFSGARSSVSGLNGFVLMDPGSGWAPSDDYTVDIEEVDWEALTGESFEEFYASGKFQRAYTDGALDSGGGYIAVISVYGGDDQMYVDSNLPAAVKTFLTSMRTWLLSVISTFGFGGDEESLVNAFSQVKFGPNPSPSSLLLQFEVLIPFEVFDGCNNVFMALPEFDWESEFADSSTFAEALGKFNNGTMSGGSPALSSARAGDVLTISGGLNAGSYVIDSVQEYALINSAAIVGGGGVPEEVDLDKAYKVALVVIRGEFPVPAFSGLPAFFSESPASWDVPPVAELPFTVTSGGVPVEGWDWVELTLKWLFQTLNSLGFDLPSEVELDVPSTLKAFWQLLFSAYSVGRPTAPQYARMLFQEPTSCTVYAPTVCERYQWAAPVPAPASLTGESITLPLPDLEGLTVALSIERVDGTTDLSATLTSAAGAASTIEDLAAALQALLDANGDYITFSGPSTATGALTITQAVGGVDELTSVSAMQVADGFRILGFYGPSPAKYPQTASLGPTCAAARESVSSASGEHLGFGIDVATTLVHVVPLAAPGYAFTVGETVTGSISHATGTVWACVYNDGPTSVLHLWLADVDGTFEVSDVIVGDSSGAEITVVSAAADAHWEGDFEDALEHQTRTFEDTAAMFTATFPAFVESCLAAGGAHDHAAYSSSFSATCSFEDQSGTGAGPGRFVLTLGDSSYAGLVSAVTADHPAGPDVTDFTTYLGDEIPLSGTATLTGGDYTPWAASPTIAVSDGTTSIEISPSLTYWTAASFESAVQALAAAADYEGAAQALNALDEWTSSSGIREIVWVGGSTLAVRGLAGGASSQISLTGLDILGFQDDVVSGTSDSAWKMTGSTAAGDAVTAFTSPHPPTLLTAVAGAAELLFTMSSEADPYQVFPGQTADGSVLATSLPRDVAIGGAYAGQLSVEYAFSDDSYASPLESGIEEEHDWIRIYEQRQLLEHAELDAVLSADRVVAVITSFGSSVVRLPDMSVGGTNAFTFLSPSGGLDGDQVQVGDALFIEEGDDLGGYTVVARGEFELTLDRPLTESTEKVYRYGNDGVAVVASAAKFTSATAQFTSDDVGRYLTLWASNRTGTDGSFKILSVEVGGCTLDAAAFTEGESDLHWAVVKAPTSTPGDSATSGRTALVGLRPIRIYNSVPKEMRVVRVTPGLDRLTARVFSALAADGTVPKCGVKQPYEFVRPAVQRISSTLMDSQRWLGLYYFDVLATSLGGDELYNIPEYTRLEPVFGTYDSDGYRIDVADNRYTFSTQEDSVLVLTPQFLPKGQDDRLSNHVALDGRSLSVEYEYAPAVAQVQGLLSSEADRVVCSNALARHFLPSYVSLDVTYAGGNSPSTVTTAVRDYVNGLSAIDEIDVSKIEGVLHANAVTRYDHPFRAVTITHDLDRRLVTTLSDGVINDDNIPYNGTNRTTFFVAGIDASGYETEQDVPAGARIRLIQATVPTTFR